MPQDGGDPKQGRFVAGGCGAEYEPDESVAALMVNQILLMTPNVLILKSGGKIYDTKIAITRSAEYGIHSPLIALASVRATTRQHISIAPNHQ